MDLLNQTAFLSAVVSLMLGASALYNRSRDRLSVAFATLCFLVCIWLSTFMLHQVTGIQTYYHLHLVANLMFAPVGFQLLEDLGSKAGRFLKTLKWISIFFAAALSLSILEGTDKNIYLKNIMLFFPSLLFFRILSLIIYDFQQWLRSRREVQNSLGTRKISRVQTVVIYVGAVLVLFTNLLDHLPGIGHIIPSLGNLILATYLYFLSLIISQQKLFGVSAIVTRFFGILFLAITLTGVFSLIAYWVKGNLPLLLLNSFWISFLLLSLWEPFKALSLYMGKFWRSPQRRRLLVILREAREKLVGVTQMETLLLEMDTTLRRIFPGQKVVIFTLSPDGTKFVSSGRTKSEIRETLSDNPLIRLSSRLRRRSEPSLILKSLIQGELERALGHETREEYLSILETFITLEGDLFLPLVSQKILGFVVVESPVPPEVFGGSWSALSLLSPYLEGASRVLSELGIYQKQKERERLAVLGEMSAGLAHEIRNPLGAIRGAAQLLEGETPANSEYLKIILEEVDRLNHVVTQFLDYSKPVNQKVESFDLAVILKKSIKLLESTLPPSVRIFVGGEPSAILRGAQTQLQQVILNLIQNSIQALSIGGKDGRIECRILSLGAKWVLEVEDNGPGVRREHLDKLFIPFFTTSPSGTGLGLAISQRIVTNHDGMIEVQSEEGAFTRIRVILPKSSDLL